MSALVEQPARERHDRPHAQRLVDDRVEVRRLTGLEVGLEAIQRRRRVQQKVEGPGQPGGGRFVAGEQQRHQLVAQLAVRHLRAVLEARGDQHREDVLAALELGVGAALGDLAREQLVGALDAARELAVVRQPPRRSEHQPDRRRRRRLGEDRDEVLAQLVAPRGVAHAEDGAHDHLERDRLHVRVKRERLTGGPAGHLLGCHLGDQRLVGAHPLAVEGRQHQLSAPQVLLALLEQERLVAEQRLEDDVASRRDRVDAVGPEEALERLGVGDEDDVAGAEEPRREGLAEHAAPSLEERDRADEEARRLEHPRQRHLWRARPLGRRRLDPCRGRRPHRYRVLAKRCTAAMTSSSFSSASSPPRSTAPRTQCAV